MKNKEYMGIKKVYNFLVPLSINSFVEPSSHKRLVS